MFRIVSHAIAPPELQHPGAGGFATFEGRVRDHNDGRRVAGIEYEAFEEMAVEQGDTILAEARERFGVLEAQAIHRVGRLGIGEMAVWVGTAAAHRREAFLATQYVIDEIKSRLPVWKREQYVDGTAEWVHCQHGGSAVSEQQLYSRQVTLPEVGAEGQRRLRDASVLVVGAGGLASSALPYLAAAGVGRIGICEPDNLDLSNLHRQVIYAVDDIGQPKGQLAARALRQLNPFVRVDVHAASLSAHNAGDLIAGYDVVLDCTDNFRAKFLLNDICWNASKPLVQASVYQFEGQVMVVDRAAGSPCLRCIWPEAPDEGCVGTCAEVGVLGVVPGLLGVLQATEAIKLVLRVGAPLTHSLVLVDLLAGETQRIERRPNPACPCCGHGVPSAVMPLEVDAESDLSPYTLVDIREPHERTPLPAVGAAARIAVPFTALLGQLDQLDPNAPYLLVCARGVRSVGMTRDLRSRGFTNVVSLAGGVASMARRPGSR